MTQSPVPLEGELRIAGQAVAPGSRTRMELPVGRLPTQTPLHLPLEVVRGVRRGPRLWLCAAIHGDELNGVEIIQRVLETLEPISLTGDVLAAPIVNVLGFIHQSRYLPDRRDLNRCFPGNAAGSLASRLAHLFMSEIVTPCSHGLDLHAGSHHRTNLPQVRGDLTHAQTRRMAEAFAAPVMIRGQAPPGSLREAASSRGMPVLVYEAGEPLRFNEPAIQIGVAGVLRVMSHLGMIPPTLDAQPPPACLEVVDRIWLRARHSGILRLHCNLGQRVLPGQILGVIKDAFGDHRHAVESPCAGLVIGHSKNPLVSTGDAIFHLGTHTLEHKAPDSFTGVEGVSI